MTPPPPPPSNHIFTSSGSFDPQDPMEDQLELEQYRRMTTGQFKVEMFREMHFIKRKLNCMDKKLSTIRDESGDNKTFIDGCKGKKKKIERILDALMIGVGVSFLTILIKIMFDVLTVKAG